MSRNTSVSDLDPATEAEIVAFLCERALPPPVRRVDTHGARLFIGRDETLKIKRPVALAYMDFSTADKRHAACRRELEINRSFAPDLYLGVDRITREADGALALNGQGTLLELAVRMRTFAADAGLDQITARGPLDRSVAEQLGDRVADLHRTAPAAAPGLGRTLGQMRDRLLEAADSRRTELGSDAVDRLAVATAQQVERAAPILDARRTRGCLRRCHGDLHLGNIVMWNNRPTPFDAIEFDEELATIDPLYDLAFLLMDLIYRGQSAAATLILNRYLWRLGESALDELTWNALAALPLAMSLRALVRTVVAVDRGRAGPHEKAAQSTAEARDYLALAIELATPPPPRLIAIGGLSGTGKSTLAAALAPGLGAAPGAIHLRSDLERKALFGVEPTARLGADGYTPEATSRAYAMVMRKTEAALAAGHSVVADAVFSRDDERASLASLAGKLGIPFTGLWLTAPEAILTARVSTRRNDASDATPDVVARQLRRGAGIIEWGAVDAGGGPTETLARARAILASPRA